MLIKTKPQLNNMNLSDAQKIAMVGRKKAEEIGIKVSIAVVDTNGYLVLVERMDGADLLTPQIACGKATATALFHTPIREFLPRIQQNPAIWIGISGMTGWRVLFSNGGIPICRAGETIGGVGVSGGKPSKEGKPHEDDVVAEEAAKALQ